MQIACEDFIPARIRFHCREDSLSRGPILAMSVLSTPIGLVISFTHVTQHKHNPYRVILCGYMFFCLICGSLCSVVSIILMTKIAGRPRDEWLWGYCDIQRTLFVVDVFIDIKEGIDLGLPTPICHHVYFRQPVTCQLIENKMWWGFTLRHKEGILHVKQLLSRSSIYLSWYHAVSDNLIRMRSTINRALMMVKHKTVCCLYRA